MGMGPLGLHPRVRACARAREATGPNWREVARNSVPLGTVDEGEPSSLHFGVRWGYVKPRGTRSEDSFVDAHRSTATLK